MFHSYFVEQCQEALFTNDAFPVARLGPNLTGHEIAKTTTAKGLRATFRSDRRKYPTGRKVTAEEMKRVHVEPNRFHGEWNYVIMPC